MLTVPMMLDNWEVRLDTALCIEPFEDDEGQGLAVINHERRLFIEDLDVLMKEGDKVRNRAIKVFEDCFWKLPRRPCVELPDQDLHTDVVRFVYDHIEFTDEGFYEVVASFILCSYIPELLRFAPRMMFYGPTRSGKSRALDVLRRLSYRGWWLLAPTGAALYRTIEEYHPTVLMDEYQDIVGDRSIDVDLVFKGGFEQDIRIPRVSSDNGSTIMFKPYSLMAIGTKKFPKEDLMNRAFQINMMEKTRDLSRFIDEDRAKDLRGRLLGFRLRSLIDPGPVAERTVEAIRRASEPMFSKDLRCNTFLDDRSIDMASGLLTSGLMFCECDDTLRLLMESQEMSKDELRDTFEAQCFNALVDMLEDRARDCSMTGWNILTDKDKEELLLDISTKDIADRLNTNLIDQGNDRKNPVKTRSVTNSLKTLGFKFRSGTGNRSYLKDENMMWTFSRNFTKFTGE